MTSISFAKGNFNVQIFSRVLRAPFFTASIVTVVLGASAALFYNGLFSMSSFILTLVGVLCLHASGNLLNDYFDFKSGADIINNSPTPYSGGSRVLVDGIMYPKEILFLSALFMASGLTLGAFLALELGWEILVFGLIGVLLGLMYTAPPFKLVYRGLGELVVALVFGPLILLGTYFVQTGSISFYPFFASLPVALLIAAVLYINEFPDYKADQSVGKKQLVVLLGPRKAAKGYLYIVAAAYLSILTGVSTGIIPPLTLLGLLTLPGAKKAYTILSEHYDDAQKLLPANRITIQLHFQTGILMSTGYLLSYLI